MKVRALFLSLLVSACASTKAKTVVEEGAAAQPRNCDEELLLANSSCAAKLNKMEEELNGLKSQLGKCEKVLPKAKAKH